MAYGATRLKDLSDTSPEAAIALVEIAPGAPPPPRAAPRPAVLVRHMLGPYLAPVGDRAADLRGLGAGQTLVADLRTRPGPDMARPFHALDVLIPWRVFDQIAGEARAAPIQDFGPSSAAPVVDPTVAHLVAAMLPALSASPRPRHLDHLCLALAGHLALRYGGLRPGGAPARGGLAPHLLRRAQDVLTADLRAAPSLAAVARACGLSARHFARAFRDSTGHTPHRWIMEVRVRAARTMMASSDERLAGIALACGFADQSHLTRVFKRETGQSPAAWRRRHAPRGATTPDALADPMSKGRPSATSPPPAVRAGLRTLDLQEPT